MRYRIGLDIGIGSVGWAVISGEYGNSRIEDFGTRLFDSGELNDSRKSTERRGFRGSRRLVRRRSFRKVLLKNHLTKIGLIDGKISDDCYKIKDEDVFTLKVRGLDERLSPPKYTNASFTPATTADTGIFTRTMTVMIPTAKRV